MTTVERPKYRVDEAIRKEVGLLLPADKAGRAILDRAPFEVLGLPRFKKQTHRIPITLPEQAESCYATAQRHMLLPYPAAGPGAPSIRRAILDLLATRSFVLYHDGSAASLEPLRVLIYPPLLAAEVFEALRRANPDLEASDKPRPFVSFSLLTETSKMTCFSFSLPAGPPSMLGTCPASVLGLGWIKGELLLRTQRGKRAPVEIDPVSFICSGCYGLKGAYGNPTSMCTQMSRLLLVRGLLEARKARPSGPVPRAILCVPDPGKLDQEAMSLRTAFRLAEEGKAVPCTLSLAEVLVLAISLALDRAAKRRATWRQFGYTYAEYVRLEKLVRERGVKALLSEDYHIPRVDRFRIHDCGDFWRTDYTRAWWEVCRTLSHIRFWAPTRAWVYGQGFTEQLLRDVPSNLILRPSSLHFREPAPSIKNLKRLGYPIFKDTPRRGRGGGFAGSTSVGIEPAEGEWQCPATHHWSEGGGALRLQAGKLVGGTCVLASGPNLERECGVCWGLGDYDYVMELVRYHEH